jgi:hypothetical protein
MKKELLLWEKAINKLTSVFIKKYFDKDADWYWVADESGGTLCINDYFFNMDRIVEAIRYNASSKKLFEFYDLELEKAKKEEDMKINFKNFLKINPPLNN